MNGIFKNDNDSEDLYCEYCYRKLTEDEITVITTRGYEVIVCEDCVHEADEDAIDYELDS